MSSEWSTFVLEDCLDALIDYRGKTPIKTEYGIPLITAKVIKGGRIETPTEFIATDDYDSWMRRGIPECGDVVLTVEAPLGEVAQLGSEKIALAQRVVTLRGKKGVLDSSYLLYWLQSEHAKDQLKARATGTTVIGIKQSELRKIEITIPSIEVQQVVAKTLQSIDDRITLLSETNKTLESIAQAIFKSWFVDFEPVHAKAKGIAPEGMDEATAALFPDSFEKTELGVVPKGWLPQQMSDVSTVSIGKTPPRKEHQWFTENSNDIRWLSIRDMGNSDLYASQTKEYLTKEAVDRFNVKCVPDNTVVMSFKMTVGRVQITDGIMATNEAIAHFNLDKNATTSAEFIYLYLKQFDFKSLSSTSSIADAVNSKSVREIPILIANQSVVDAFQLIIIGIFQKIKINEAQVRSMSNLRDTLLPRLISGQLRIEEAQEMVESV
jgi:type I restriction enzyme S subunit